MRRAPAGSYLLVVGVAVTALAGCGGLPLPSGSKAVKKVSAAYAPPDTAAVRRIPPGPETGAGPDSIVAGFLAAGADPDVAREYLTPGNTWDPDSGGTTVFSGDPVVRTSAAGSGLVTASAQITPLLTIGIDGATSPGGGPDRLDLTLTRAAGEWRIAGGLRAGTYLRQPDLAAGFRRAMIAWLTPDRRGLVRESILLPGTADSQVPDVVSALLQGPLTRLGNAGVTTALPHLSLVQARVNGNELEVSLQGPIGSLSAADLPAARAQLAATLLALPDVNAIRVDIDGQPLVGGSSGPVITAVDEAGFDRDDPSAAGSVVAPFVAGVATITQETEGSPVTERVVPGGPPVALAVDSDGQQIAELQRVTGGTRPFLVSGRLGVAQPLASSGNWTSLSWGDGGTLWFTRDGAVLVSLRGRPPVAASSPLALRSILLAPDGVHVVGVTTGGRLVLGLADASAAAPALVDLHEVATGLEQVGSVAITDEGIGGIRVLVSATRSGDGPTAARASGTAAPVGSSGLSATGSGPPGAGSGLSAAGSGPLAAGSGLLAAERLWTIDLGAPDAATGEVASVPVTAPTACGPPVHGSSPRSLLTLAARPGVRPLATCSDGTVLAFSGSGWADAYRGLAAYPLG